MRCRHEMPFGAQLRVEGGCDFHLWAPAARNVELALYDAWPSKPRVLPASGDDAGFWQCHVREATAGALYHWRINGESRVPDPASRSNPYGVHEPSCVVDALAFDWGEDWAGRPWDETVLYELHVGAFTPEGTFAAAQGKLDELAALGITAVELMPVSDFPGRFGWGYDGVLHYAPHAAYGSPDDLKRFVAHAHSLGLMVFMDVVYNHFGPSGNYLGSYAPQLFSSSRQSPWGAAIDFESRHEVREFFVHNALYWIEEFRIDGLRLDAVHAIADASSPDILQELSSRVRAATSGRHVHLVLENENNNYERLASAPEPGRYDAQWNDDFHHALHVALTGETHAYYHDYGDEPVALLARSLAQGMLFEASPRLTGGARERVVEAPPQPLSTLVNFAANHDQTGNRAFGERLNTLAPAGAGEIATLLALLTPAIPLLFFGEEFGSTTPFLYFADWKGDLREAVRQGREREFGHAARAAGRPLPDPCSPDTFASVRPDPRERESTQGRRWLDLVQRALEARREHITPRQARLATGQHIAQRVGETGIRVRWHYDDGEVLQLEVNLGTQPLHVHDGMLPLADAREVFRHAWPGGLTAEMAGDSLLPRGRAGVGASSVTDSSLPPRGRAGVGASSGSAPVSRPHPNPPPEGEEEPIWPAWAARWTLGREA